MVEEAAAPKAQAEAACKRWSGLEALRPAAEAKVKAAAKEHVCGYCGGAFSSKNQLFAHLRNSACTARAAADGLKVVEKPEKVALIVGYTSVSPGWREQALWPAVDAARGVGVIPGLESYAERGGPPGVSFASDACGGGELPADASCDVASLTTEAVRSDEDRAAWCAKVNARLPDNIRVFGRTVGLPTTFHAEGCCLRRTFSCLVPMLWLLVDPTEEDCTAARCAAETGGFEAGTRRRSTPDAENEDDDDDDPGNISALQAATAVVSVLRRKATNQEHQPGWGDGEAGEVLLGQFHRLKGVLRRFQGEVLFHNFADARLSPADALARRNLFRCRAVTRAEEGATAFSVAADTLLAGQLRAMVGLIIAVQRGLLPEAYLDAALGNEALLPIPQVPEGTEFLAGCVYNKQFHHLLRPGMECPDAEAFRQRLEDAATARALEGDFKGWFEAALVQSAPEMGRLLTRQREPEAPGGATRDEPSDADAPEEYREVLRLLREAEASGKWPGISKGREKVIKEATLAEKGGGGGSFSVGSMPPPLEAPGCNAVFPDLSARAFLLEGALMPNRQPSSTIAVNKKAQFLPHVDSGAGAGQGISLIVGLGNYTGGELVVEGVVHDIRYKPLEFNGWTQRHWTLPFSGERFSLVWFTPVGCEHLPGIQVCPLKAKPGPSRRRWGSSGREGVESASQRFEPCPRPPVSGGAVGSTATLRNGLPLPRLGLGTFQLSTASAGPGEASGCEEAVTAALSAGYRLLDCASIYKNEEAVGRALRRWEEANPGGDGGPVMVCSKCSPYEMGFQKAQDACSASLVRLGRDALDLYLIHWPALPKVPHDSPKHRVARRETWKALEELYRSGHVRAIGVSNFTAEHLRQLLEDGVQVVPMVNQIEAHPLYVPGDVIDFCSSNGIVVEAYSPLGAGPASNAAKATGGKANGTRILLGHDAVRKVAAEVGRTPAQVLLRWGIQKGFVVIPRSRDPGRIAENGRVFDFELSDQQVARLDALRKSGEAQKFCWNPATVS